MWNLRTAMPIIKLFNATFYISVCNVEATSKCVIKRNYNSDVELKPSLF